MLSVLSCGLIFSFVSAGFVLAQDVWTGGGPDDLWSTKANWSTPPPPSLGENIIMAGPGHLENTADTTVYGAAPREWKLSSILFPVGAPNFLLHLDVVTIGGSGGSGGILNSSGKLQIIDVDAGNALTNTTTGALTVDGGTIGSNVLLENKGGTAATPEPGTTQFLVSSAGFATINNFGGFDNLHASGGSTLFASPPLPSFI